MSSIHNPSNFNPADYEVVEYLDNKPPAFYPVFGGTTQDALDAVEQHRRELDFWKANNARLLGADWNTKIHHCAHCGNGRVRWVTVAHHAPTGENVVFGADCTARLDFKNGKEFQLVRLQRLADAQAASLKAYNFLQVWLREHPAVAEVAAKINEPVHAKNTFARDVLQKLARYGSISDRQEAALLKSMAEDVRRANAPVEVKVAAPTGKGVRFSGEVVSRKLYEGDYGSSWKLTVKVTTPQGIWLAWGTAPRDVEDAAVRGTRIELTANLEAGNDPSFVFFKRPRLAVVTPQEPEPPAPGPLAQAVIEQATPATNVELRDAAMRLEPAPRPSLIDIVNQFQLNA